LRERQVAEQLPSEATNDMHIKGTDEFSYKT